MRLFHLSDLHIGIKLYNHDLCEDQEYIFGQIIEYVKEYQPDAILIAGDIYDKPVPSVESVQLFNHFMECLYEACGKAELMLISGNHDSAQRLDYFSWLLSYQRVHMAGIPPRRPNEYMKKVTLHDEYGAVNFYLLPFSKPSILRGVFEEEEASYTYHEALHQLFAREHIDENERNVLVSHQFYLPLGANPGEVERAESEIAAVGNIDVIGADVLTPFDYVALGHIHKPMTVGENRFRYSGTPLAYSVSEANQKKGLLIIELGKKGKEIDIMTLPLTPKRKVVAIEDTFENVQRQASEDYVHITLTDTEDLEVVDLQERLHLAFPNLLEIRRKNVRGMEFSNDEIALATANPFDLICEFIPDMDEEEKEILQSVINEAMEVGE